VGLFDSLRAACPSLAMRTDAALLDATGVDALRPGRGRPELAALRRRPLALAEPMHVDEVAALLRWASGARVAVVPRGGGSGLMGGAAVLGGPALVVDLHRLDTVTVDADGCIVRAGAGATLARVDAALAEHGLMLGHDPWTFAVATVGGALATNGLGYLGARAGSVGAQVRALEAVLADGTIVRTRAAPARSVGLDLARFLVGTEGTLGIITEATLAALSRPEERIAAEYRLPSFSAGVSIAIALRRAGVQLACLELSAAGLPPRTASLLLVFDGLRGEARLRAERATGLIRDAGGEPLPEGTAEREWRERHAIAERWAAGPRFVSDDWQPGRSADQFDYAHVGVPVAALERVREVAHALVRRHRLALREEGLWHWPELYSVVVAGPPESAAGVRATIDGVCRAAQDAGGTMEYCHGVGWKLAHLAEREHGAAGLDVLRRTKAALDPAGILNPGKGGL
jgi:FAD/FMN-containing dehydrogenase